MCSIAAAADGFPTLSWRQYGFLAIIVYAIQSYNYLAIPFLLLFVGGYYWAGVRLSWSSIKASWPSIGSENWQRRSRRKPPRLKPGVYLRPFFEISPGAS